MKAFQNRAIFVLLLGVVLFRIPVYAETISTKHDINSYVEELKHKAEQGNAEAQYRLGSLYDEQVSHDLSVNYSPRGIYSQENLFDDKNASFDEYPARNNEEALKWYRKAAIQGHVKAQYYLGRLYSSDYCGPDWFDYSGIEGGPQYKESVKWFEKAAQQNHPESQYCLALLFFNEIGVAQNDVKALELLKKAAMQNVIDAKILLGHLYFEGRGVAQNLSKAADLYRDAIKRNEGCEFSHNKPSLYLDAYIRLGNMYFSGTGVNQNYIEALRWYEMSVAPGKSSESYEYYSGNDEASSVALKNYPLALEWTLKAARQNNVEAQALIGYLGLSGNYDNKIEALDFSRKAAASGNNLAQFYLGSSYNCFDNFTGDCKEGVKWLKRSAEQDNIEAQCALGKVFESGQGVIRDVPEAVAWYARAANSGSVGAWIRLKEMAISQQYPEAQFALGHLYAEGCCGLKRNEQNALKLFQMAADQGYGPAIEAIENMKGGKQ